ncbi:hypothetical protein SELMODRAFT_429151 [Selaginella moellendorffii]|uniref:Uncharacterized protein n=1 Tax=Selaginella moellendorffii TaxID=88036 RepID=D8T579_SELML|nr:hypothetical protein SELMODRAFT_429151 [Selaginella moellendorffii]
MIELELERLALSSAAAPRKKQEQQHSKRKKKKGKKKKKQSGGRQQPQRGDSRNPLSRAFRASADDGIAGFVRKACEALAERKRRIFMWEATLLLGTHFMKQALQQATGIAETADAREVFWSIVQAKAGIEQYREIVARAAGKRQPRPALPPPPDTASGSSSPTAAAAATLAPPPTLDLNTSNKRSLEVVIRDLDEHDEETQRLEEEQERKRLKMQETIQELSVRFEEAVNFATPL